MLRVVCTGSESTGKTTLGSALAEHYGVELVPEFVRSFAAQIGRAIDFTDHGPIARGQMALEDAEIARGGPLVIQDTDLLSTVVYCQHYFGRCPAWIEQEADRRRPDLYLLCAVDAPWVADGIRDRGHVRDKMQSLFATAVAASGVPYVAISGSMPDRMARAIAAIDERRR